MTLCLSLKLKYYSNGLTMQNTSALSERTFPSKERIHSYLKSTRYTPTLIETASIYRGSVFFCLVWSVRAGVYKSANVKDKYICYFQKVIGVREVVVFCYMMLFINCSITFTQCNILLKHSAALLVQGRASVRPSIKYTVQIYLGFQPEETLVVAILGILYYM